MRPTCLPAIVLTLPLLLTACAGTGSQPPRTVAVAGAPKAIGPYAQAVVANGFVFLSGSLARDPVSGAMVQGDIEAHVNRIFDNNEAILAGAGASLKDVVKVTVYMTDLSDFNKMNEAYGKRFNGHTPARTTIQAAKLPGGAPLEIEMIARLP